MFFNGSSLSGDHTIDSEIITEESHAIRTNTSALTALRNFINSLHQSQSSFLPKVTLHAKHELIEMKIRSPGRLSLSHLISSGTSLMPKNLLLTQTFLVSENFPRPIF